MAKFKVVSAKEAERMARDKHRKADIKAAKKGDAKAAERVRNSGETSTGFFGKLFR